MDAASKQNMKLMHSRGKPGASFPTTNIGVRFAPAESFNLQIKYQIKTSLQNKPFHTASLFRIAAMVGSPITPTSEIPGSAKMKGEFATFGRKIAKSMAAEIVKPQPEIPVTEACGWTFPIRK
jgi:hypothetical protein